MPTVVDLDVVEAKSDYLKSQRRNAWRAKPYVRVWANPPQSSGHNGLVLRGVASDSLEGNFKFTRREVSTGTLKLRLDHFLAKWMISIPNDPEAKKNVVITVDHMGGKLRWSGLLHNWQVKKDGRGVYYFEATFIDDRQYLQYLLGAPNPALPIPLFQFPRVLPGFGPTKWIASMFILINLMRVNGNWWNLPDDPFDWGSWTSGFDMTKWQAHVVAPKLLHDSSLWGLIATRMDTLESVIQENLDMAQLTLEYRRIITDDGETAAEYGLSHVGSVLNGALVLKIVDNSGFYNPDGTAFSGGLFSGLTRSVMEFGAGFVEEYIGPALTDDESLIPDQYYQSNKWLPKPEWPWIILRDSKWSQIDTASIGWSPAGPVAACVGGDNPYADQMIQLAIQAVGNILGYFALGGFSSAGDIAATVIMPFLQGTVLAWLYWKNTQRATQLGWAHLYETRGGGGDQNAWSLSSFAALTGAFAATKSTSSHVLTMNGSGPVYPGIHFLPGHRIGSTAEKIIPGFMHVDAVESIGLQWNYVGDDRGHKYDLQVGRNEAAMPFAEKFAKLYSRSLDVISQLGVRMIS